MRKFTCIFFLFFLHLSFSQKIFSVEYKSQADVKIFVVEYKSQADLCVYKVDYKSKQREMKVSGTLKIINLKLTKKFILQIINQIVI